VGCGGLLWPLWWYWREECGHPARPRNRCTPRWCGACVSAARSSGVTDIVVLMCGPWNDLLLRSPHGVLLALLVGSVLCADFCVVCALVWCGLCVVLVSGFGVFWGCVLGVFFGLCYFFVFRLGKND
jgi:hypothetical protein